MSGFLPFAGKNAIVEMNIAIQFAMPIEQQAASAAESVRIEFAREFPKFDPVQTFMLNIGVQPFPAQGVSQTIAGFTLTKQKPDGTPARVIRAMSNILSVHFVEYISWNDTKPQAVDYVRRCLEKLAIINRNPVTTVLLRYIDRFTFDGPPGNATANQLFRADTKFVPSNIMDRGYQWHSNSGWLEPFGGNTAALNQLSIISDKVQTAAAVNVDHNNIYALAQPRNSIGELIDGVGEELSLNAILDRQHTANAALLRNLLRPEMLRAIGL